MALENLKVKQKPLTLLQALATLTVAFWEVLVANGSISVVTAREFQICGEENRDQVLKFSFKLKV
jgi:hypothetical protein